MAIKANMGKATRLHGKKSSPAAKRPPSASTHETLNDSATKQGLSQSSSNEDGWVDIPEPQGWVENDWLILELESSAP